MPNRAFLFVFFYVFFCGIIISIMKSKISVFSLLTILSICPAFAGWQYDGYYMSDGYYEDDGSRFVMSLRGGLSFANAKMKNDIGSLDATYYANDTTGMVITELVYQNAGQPSDYTLVGTGNVGDLPARENFSKTAFTAGASIGFTIPYHQQWRIEAGFDHIAETDYNEIPMFQGSLKLSSGETVNVSSSGVKSTITTDVISAMAYYDFFDGLQKPVHQIIPYIGFGAGYAMSKTLLNLSDIYGDLTEDQDLRNFGTVESGVLQFDTPSSDVVPSSTNVALLGALGFSYGITQYTFLDFNARLMYVPKITWALVSADGTQKRDWFSAENMLYTNLMVGLRFEF